MKLFSLLILLNLLISGPGATAATKSKNLVGAWRLEEKSGTTTADFSGNGNTGTLTASPTRVAGKFGTALSFDGSTQYVTIPDSASLEVAGQVTVAAWIKMSSFPSGWANIVSKGFDGATEGYDLRLNYFTTTLEILSYNGGNYTTTYDISSWTTGTWYHVVGLYDGSNWKLYVNGVNVSTTASGTGALGDQNNRPVMIGAFDNSGSAQRFFPGVIDEVRIYNRALKPSEIRALMLGYEPGEY